MKQTAVASAMTYATNHGVSMLLLCSTVESDHWLSKFKNIREGNKPGVCLIQVKYLCDSCAADGQTGICVHGKLKIPNHIDTSGEVEEDPVRQAMDFVSPGSYQLEVCGSNFHTSRVESRAFDVGSIERLHKNTIQVDCMEFETVYLALDPVQAGSGISGIGLAVVGCQEDSYVVLGLDQFVTEEHHLGQLNDIHKDLILTNLNFLCHLYPALWKKPVKIFVEANLSQDLAAFLEQSIKRHYINMCSSTGQGFIPKFVKQHDAHGRVLPGVLTQHKGNLVSYFKRTLDEGKLFLANQISSVSKAVRAKYQTMGLTEPLRPNATETIDLAIDQLKNFRCIRKGKKLTYSGKQSTRDSNQMDDMVMALIICVAWVRLPENMYIVT